MNAQFVVENRPGAGGATGTQYVAKASPNGYTLLLGSNATLLINPTVNKETTYDGEKDFEPIAAIARTGMILVTGTSEQSPKSVAELLKLAKEKPLNYASTGVGALGHLTSEIFLRRTGLAVRHVPYKSSSESLTDVMRGEVAFAHDSVAAALPLIQGGSLRALAVTGNERLKSLPDVPTFDEAGIRDMNITVWYGVWAPAGTPKPIVERLSREIGRLQSDPAVLQRLHSVEFQSLPLDTPKLKSYFASEKTFWQRYVEGAK